MSGIYIHIPFCKQKCIYCNFCSIVSQNLKAPYLDALLKEIDLRKDYLRYDAFQTIYFGGGTPSILTIEELLKISEKLQSTFSIAQNAEITLEANPEQLTNEYLKDLKNYTNLNRLSIGIQSFSDNILKYLFRKHSSKKSIECIENAFNFGFKNLTIDLIYGIPVLSNEEWIKTLNTAISLPVKHLSAYALTLEPETILGFKVRQGLAQTPEEEKAIEQYHILKEKIIPFGFRQYEISNFAKEGFESKHNSNYWNASPYLGLGASAHSYNGISRQWNINRVENYIHFINSGKPFFEKEILTEKDKFNEFLMLSLRKTEGINKDIFTSFSNEYIDLFKTRLSKLFDQHLMAENEDFYYLTESGLLFADKIAAELFV